MNNKKSFVVYATWRSYFELLEDPELIRDLLYAIFDLAEGKDVVVTNNKVRTAFNAIEPIMREDLEAYEAKCEKNKLAAQKRWGNSSDMRSHTDAKQTDGDNDNANDNDNDNDNVNENDIDMSVLSGTAAPSVDDVIEASHNRGIEMPKKDAEEFIAFYFVDLKGLINGEPIRNWRNLLKSWDNNKLVETDSILGADYAGYEEFKKLPPYLQNQIVNEQTKFGGRKVTRATVKAIEQYRSSVLEQNREAV